VSEEERRGRKRETERRATGEKTWLMAASADRDHAGRRDAARRGNGSSGSFCLFIPRHSGIYVLLYYCKTSDCRRRVARQTDCISVRRPPAEDGASRQLPPAGPCHVDASRSDSEIDSIRR